MEDSSFKIHCFLQRPEIWGFHSKITGREIFSEICPGHISPQKKSIESKQKQEIIFLDH